MDDWFYLFWLIKPLYMNKTLKLSICAGYKIFLINTYPLYAMVSNWPKAWGISGFNRWENAIPAVLSRVFISNLPWTEELLLELILEFPETSGIKRLKIWLITCFRPLLASGFCGTETGGFVLTEGGIPKNPMGFSCNLVYLVEFNVFSLIFSCYMSINEEKWDFVLDFGIY